MNEIFLSASVPERGRGRYYVNANPFLIQTAVRELIVAVIRDYKLVWGGHPAITPMVWAVCEDLGVSYEHNVVLYQSRYFQQDFPDENERFSNVVLVDAVEGDREDSLNRMRHSMLSRPNLNAAVFIGGMEGIIAEHRIYREYHPAGKVLFVAAPGGAAKELAKAESRRRTKTADFDFAQIFRTEFPPSNSY